MHNIIFDWKRTLYDPDEDKLIAGAREILQFFYNQKIPVAILGKGGTAMLQRVQALGISNLVSATLFIQEEHKNPEMFQPYVYAADPEQTWVVGDRVRSEIEVGNELGCTTVWIQQGKFASEKPMRKMQEPTYAFHSLEEFLRLQQDLQRDSQQ